MKTEADALFERKLIAALDHLLRFAKIPQHQQEYFGALLEMARDRLGKVDV